MPKDTGKDNKSNAQKASDKNNDDSMIRDLKEKDRTAEASKIKGGVAKKRAD
jgi:hypothetical protein